VHDALGELIARIDPALVPSRARRPAVAPEPPVTASVTPPNPARLDTAAGAATAPLAPAPRLRCCRRRAAAAPAPPTAAERQRVDRLVIVALDPGHGGEDPGAIGPTGLREKDVVLAIALQLRDKLNAVPGMRVMLTRDADFFVPLHERVRKARRVQADLFVSIHADAFMQARGARRQRLCAVHQGRQQRRGALDGRTRERGRRVGGVNVARCATRRCCAPCWT
jgi:N-acetylmuramoyl-L-alanine amidase